MTLGFRLFAPQHNLAFLRYFRGNLELAKGDLPAAREAHAEALALAEKFGERVQAERARLALGLVALREGKLDEAVGDARGAAGAFEKLELPSEAAQAR